MLTICRSSKGGSGTSTVTAGLAVLTALHHFEPPQVERCNPASPLVIDLAGDLPAILGVAYPTSGLAEWLTRFVDHDFSDLVITCGRSLRLMSSGSFALPDASSALWNRLAAIVHDEINKGHQVFIDCGTQPIPESLLQKKTPESQRILLILRPCYLALRRAMSHSDDADGIVLITGGGRVLTRRDVESVLGVPIVAEVPLDPDIARRVDSGLFHSRLPKVLTANLTPLILAPKSKLPMS